MKRDEMLKIVVKAKTKCWNDDKNTKRKFTEKEIYNLLKNTPKWILKRHYDSLLQRGYIKEECDSDCVWCNA